MYSLTQATEKLINHYNIGSSNCKSDEIIKYNNHKIRHSNGVLEVGRNILIKISENRFLSENIKNKAEICFLLHDLGRFYQNNKERILTNNEFEHGDSSYKIAKEEGYSDDICLAIKYHNKYSISSIYEEESYISMNKEEKEITIFLAEITRDADKLQNMIYIIFNINGLTNLNPKLENGDISDEVLNDIINKILVDRKNIKTVVDDIIGILGWLNDINFEETTEILKYYKYKEKVIEKIFSIDGITKEKIQILKDNL